MIILDKSYYYIIFYNIIYYYIILCNKVWQLTFITIQWISFFIILIASVINGTVEEVFWRGTFIYRYPNNIFKSFLFPCIFFIIWHISLASINEVQYQGGALGLIGGAFFGGIIWGLVAYKEKSILYTIITHILVNFLGFTGLIIDNWF